MDIAACPTLGIAIQTFSGIMGLPFHPINSGLGPCRHGSRTLPDCPAFCKPDKRSQHSEVLLLLIDSLPISRLAKGMLPSSSCPACSQHSSAPALAMAQNAWLPASAAKRSTRSSMACEIAQKALNSLAASVCKGRKYDFDLSALNLYIVICTNCT